MHLITPFDLDDAARAAIVQRARAWKASDAAPTPSRLRAAALFMNPSLRTRASFEQAVGVLGGRCQSFNAGADLWQLEYDPQAVMDGAAVENVVEAARVFGAMMHVLGVRAFRSAAPWAQERDEPVLTSFARHAGIPVMSLEGAAWHPLQGLADLVTTHEAFGDPRGLPVAVCWAWHPKALPPAVPQTAIAQFALAGCDVTLVHPEGWALDADVVDRCRQEARGRGGDLRVTHDRDAGLRGRRLVYVKSWGRLHDPEPTPAGLRSWCVDQAALAPTDDARVMHCLPVRRNVVVGADVLDSPRSLVTQQAGNRLWSAVAALEHIARASGVL